MSNTETEYQASTAGNQVMEPSAQYRTKSRMTPTKAEQTARLVNSIQELTAILSDRLWNDPEYDGVKDRYALLAMIDASHAAASELSALI